MFRLLILLCCLLLSACGTKEMDSTVDDNRMLEEYKWMEGARGNLASVEKEAEISSKQVIELLEQMETVRRDVVDKIAANGWYESIGEIEPTKTEFKHAIGPIVSEIFTKEFVEEQVIGQMETFFCYCDAPTPLHGKMIPDVTQNLSVNQDTIVLNAYRPANGMYSGAKFSVILEQEDGKWKIDGLEQQFGSHEKSFHITSEQVIQYYKNKGIDLNFHSTLKANGTNSDVLVFEWKDEDKWLAVQSRDWYTVEGKELIQQLYGFQAAKNTGISFKQEI